MIQLFEMKLNNPPRKHMSHVHCPLSICFGCEMFKGNQQSYCFDIGKLLIIAESMLQNGDVLRGTVQGSVTHV